MKLFFKRKQKKIEESQAAAVTCRINKMMLLCTDLYICGKYNTV